MVTVECCDFLVIPLVRTVQAILYVCVEKTPDYSGFVFKKYNIGGQTLV